MRRKYLDNAYDSGIDPDPNWDPAKEIDKNLERLYAEAALGWNAEAIPRRLGKDATPLELKRDKAFSKRYAYGVQDLLKQWGATPSQITKAIKQKQKDPKLRSKAAQIDWEDHIYQLCAILRHEMRYTATNGRHHNEDKAANAILLRLDNEINQQVQRFENVYSTKISLEKIPETAKKRE